MLETGSGVVHKGRPHGGGEGLIKCGQLRTGGGGPEAKRTFSHRHKTFILSFM